MDKRNKWLKKHCTQYSFQPLIADSRKKKGYKLWQTRDFWFR